MKTSNAASRKPNRTQQASAVIVAALLVALAVGGLRIRLAEKDNGRRWGRTAMQLLVLDGDPLMAYPPGMIPESAENLEQLGVGYLTIDVRHVGDERLLWNIETTLSFSLEFFDKSHQGGTVAVEESYGLYLHRYLAPSLSVSEFLTVFDGGVEVTERQRKIDTALLLILSEVAILTTVYAIGLVVLKRDRVHEKNPHQLIDTTNS